MLFWPRSYAHRESGHKYLCFFGQEAMHIGSLDINIYAFFCQEAMHIGSLDLLSHAPLFMLSLKGSHKLWKTWKITKNSMHGKIMEFKKKLNKQGKIIRLIFMLYCQEAMHIGVKYLFFFCQEAMHIGSLNINIYVFFAKKLCTSGVWT